MVQKKTDLQFHQKFTGTTFQSVKSILVSDYSRAIRRLAPRLVGNLIGTLIWTRWRKKPLRPALSKLLTNWLSQVSGYMLALHDQRVAAKDAAIRKSADDFVKDVKASFDKTRSSARKRSLT